MLYAHKNITYFFVFKQLFRSISELFSISRIKKYSIQTWTVEIKVRYIYIIYIIIRIYWNPDQISCFLHLHALY